MKVHNSAVKSRMRRSDNLTPNERRRAMRAVRGRDTAPERRVASILRALRIRYRAQGDLPGKPDFVLPQLRAALFVQGCFWHAHGCRSKTPITNRSYWTRKLTSNRARDRRVRRALNGQGWSVLVLWECRIATREDAVRAVARALKRAARRGRRRP